MLTTMKYEPDMFKLFILIIVLLLSMQAVAKDNADEKKGMVLVPAGEFIMGSNKVDEKKKSTGFGNVKPWYVDEHPKHTVILAAYYIDQYEVTNKH